MAVDQKLNFAWWALRMAIGLAAFLAGLDKFFNILADWTMYISPWAARLLPISPHTFMHIIGPVEMLVGLAILTRWTEIGAFAASVWLLIIALNLATSGLFYDLAVRDAVMAVAAYALANLTAVRESADSGGASKPRSQGISQRPAAAA